MSRAIPVLMYHHVSPSPGLVTVTPENFDSQMAGIAQKGYRTLAADEFLDIVEGRGAMPARSVFITFDDGYLDNYVYAWPILRRYNLRATIFAITGRIGDGVARACAGSSAVPPPTPDHRSCGAAIAENRADGVMLRWSEIEKMEQSGTVEIHSHTHTHQRWDQLFPVAAARVAAVAEDIGRSRQELEKRLGKRSLHLCWPWGYFEPDYLDAATQAGFSALYTVERGVAVAGQDPRRIPRVTTKNRPGAWLNSRLAIYRHSWLARFYIRLRGA